MAQIINTNTMSLNAQRNLSTSGNSLATSIQRLSSGLRINSAKDDAAGLAISERFTTQIRGINQAARNANDGISLAQTAEGALGEIGNNLQRIRELAVQARNATNSDSDRQALNAEVQLLKAEIQRVAEQTNFNGTNLLDGSFTNQAFQIGADQGQTINISQIANANIKELGNWNQVDTSATFTAIAPAGTGGGVAGPGLASLSLAGVADPTATFTFEVDGTEVTVAADGARDAAGLAAEVATQINSVRPGLASADGNDVALENTGAAAVVVDTFSNGVAAQTVAAQGAGGTATFSAGSFTLTGAKGTATINFAAAGGAGQRASDLVKSINDQSYNTGVTASLDSNGRLLLASQDGDFTLAGGATLTEQTGLTAGTTAGAAIGSAWAAGLPKSGFADLDITSTLGADNALNAMDAALTSINSSRADLGAVQNRFSSTIANLTTSSENMSAARSRIRDTDYATETAELTRTQILQQAGTAMLAQANQAPQNVLSLLQS
ncbi:flagellin [Stenotrophomonas sp. CFBP8980]|jgi:flagellin|uniref:flagellin n=1 Tax=Stenotrophomonas sp. CFBP8980 TaxID=3096523 RepID=UPI002A6B15AC|nr:flagellin [Stenotrophomonas sp. CFBP8980]MDY1033938.1 flagellin [Stenotrophomonas sp. CFBP8980]